VPGVAEGHLGVRVREQVPFPCTRDYDALGP
jgi:hypothetical protein